MTCARELSRSPKYGTFSPSLESFTLASADSQNWNVSRSRATSVSFGAPAATAERLGGATPPMLEQRASFPAPMCPITSPKLICAGVGLNPYLPAGISSAAAMKLVPARAAAERTASETGATGSCAAPLAARDQVASAMSRTDVCMSRIQVTVGCLATVEAAAAHWRGRYRSRGEHEARHRP